MMTINAAKAVAERAIVESAVGLKIRAREQGLGRNRWVLPLQPRRPFGTAQGLAGRKNTGAIPGVNHRELLVLIEPAGKRGPSAKG